MTRLTRANNPIKNDGFIDLVDGPEKSRNNSVFCVICGYPFALSQSLYILLGNPAIFFQYYGIIEDPSVIY